MPKIILQKEWYTVEQCKNNPNNLYIFGDNTLRIGKAGQAIIRDCKNSFGIATKINPGMKINDFMKDDIQSLKIIKQDILGLIKISKSYNNIIFPYSGLGRGLSDMPNKCPLLYEILKDKLHIYFGIKYP